jgi:hypothetical protein
VRIVASAPATAEIETRGGSLWVWTQSSRCCGASVRLEAATTPRPKRTFELVAQEPFDVHLATGFPRPDELHIELTRRGNLRAYWNGCAWVS